MASNDPGTASDFVKKADYYLRRGNLNMAESWNNTAKLINRLDVEDMKKRSLNDKLKNDQKFAFR